jgi:hypothetical protein
MRVGIVSLYGVALLAVLSTRVAAQESAIRGRVIDARTKRPVASTVELRASDTTIVREGSAEFVIAKLPAGRFELVVRAIGYQSLTMRVALEANDTLVADVDLERIATKLAAVRTDSAALPAGYASRLSEFEERRASGFGKFLDWQYFEQNKDRRLRELLNGRIAGLRVEGTLKGETFLTTRTGRRCKPQVFVNGVLDSNFDLSLIDTREVLALEFYTPATTPFKYNGTAIGSGGAGVCGTVLLWLR